MNRHIATAQNFQIGLARLGWRFVKIEYSIPETNNGNEVFVNNFMRQPGQPQIDPNGNWLHVFRYPVQ
ncbi:MAG: hypothetical protein E5X07_32220 [Mesorhizobium sp.]|nr:MAG: hypothetical protein E5X07_32220 [Mesorhizobium sp.]